MPVNPQEYLLKFDLTETDNQISAIERSYTDFGNTIKNMSSKMKEDMRLFQEQLDSIITSAGLLKSSMTGVSDILEKMVESSTALADNLGPLASADLAAASTPASRVADILPKTAAGLPGGPEAEAMKEVRGLAEEAQKQAEAALKASEDTLKKIQKSTEDTKKEVNWLIKHIKKEVKGIRSGMARGASMFMPSGMMGGLAGGFITSIIALTVLGYKEDKRKEAEAAEMLNVFSAMGEDFFKKSSKSMSKWWSDFAEKAQWYYGVSRKEIQHLAKMFVDAGDKGEALMTTYDDRLGKVGKNLGMATMAMDLHLGKAVGTHAKSMIDMMALYGDTAFDAADKTVKIGMAAQKSGMNMDRFVNSIMTGSQALAQYGIDVKDVAHVMQALKKHYQDMGLSDQYAGELGAQAVTGITSGLANLPKAIQVLLGEELHPGKKGLEARQELLEGYKRVLSGQDEGQIIRMAKGLLNIVQQQTGGGRQDMITWLEHNLKQDPVEAAAFIDIVPELKEANKLSDLSKKEQKQLRKVLGLREKMVKDEHKIQRDLIRGLSTIGEGLISVISGLTGSLILLVKSLPVMAGVLTGQYKEPMKVLAELSNVMGKQTDSIMSGIDKIIEAFGDKGPLADAMNRMFPEGSPIRSAAAFDPTKGMIHVPAMPERDPETKQGQWLKDKLENVISEAAAQEVVREVEAQSKALKVGLRAAQFWTNPVSGAIGGGAKFVVDAWINGEDLEESQRKRRHTKSPGPGD